MHSKLPVHNVCVSFRTQNVFYYRKLLLKQINTKICDDVGKFQTNELWSPSTNARKDGPPATIEFQFEYLHTRNMLVFWNIYGVRLRLVSVVLK